MNRDVEMGMMKEQEISFQCKNLNNNKFEVLQKKRNFSFQQKKAI